MLAAKGWILTGAPPISSLQMDPLLPRCVGGHHGDGITVERRRSPVERRFGLCSSSSTLDERRWRLLKRFFLHGHRGGGRWPTFSSPPVNLLAEWRPYLFLPALLPLGRQFRARMVVVAFGNDSFVAPSGCVPRRRRGASQASVVDLIAFPVLRWRSFLQSLRACLYFLFLSGPVCKICCYVE